MIEKRRRRTCVVKLVMLYLVSVLNTLSSSVSLFNDLNGLDILNCCLFWNHRSIWETNRLEYIDVHVEKSNTLNRSIWELKFFETLDLIFNVSFVSFEMSDCQNWTFRNR